jgi:hypothetical protein
MMSSADDKIGETVMQSAFKAGAGTAIITPPLGTSLAGYFRDRKSIDIHDELTAKAVVVESGDTHLAIVVCDLICAPREYLDQAKALIYERCHIPPENIMINCTHTHTGPATTGLLGTLQVEEYWDFAVPKIVHSIQLALKQLCEAELGFGSGSEPRCVFNRRYRMKDGTVQMNPGRLNPDIVEPVGPIDPELGVLCLREAETHNIIAVLANYALHYVGGGESLSVSADYFGEFGRILPHMLGQDFVAIVANGCSGDVNNINVYEKQPQQKPYEQMEKVATMIAAEAAKTITPMTFMRECALAVANDFIKAGVRHPSPEQLTEDRRRLAEGEFENERERIYAQERLLVAQEPEEICVQVQAMRIGELALVAWPGEMFCQLGLEVKEHSPAAATFIVELANDYIGYVPTVTAFQQGGYETWLARSSKVGPGTGEAIVKSTMELLKRLFGTKS